MIFVLVLCGFLGGIVAVVVWPVWGIVAAAIFAVGIAAAGMTAGHLRGLVAAVLAVVAVGCGVMRGTAAVTWLRHLPETPTATLVFDGVTLRSPTIAAWEQRVPVEVRSCANGPCPVHRILLTTDPFAMLPGARSGISGTCELAPVRNFSDTVDYRAILATQGVTAICHATTPVVSWQPHRLDDRALAIAAAFRDRLEEGLRRTVPAPSAGLGAGLIFGGDGRLSDELQDVFRTAGLTHIVAVSGYNITIIAACVLGLALAIGARRRVAGAAALLGVAVFVVLIGAPVSAVRAAVMGGLVLALGLCGRLAAGPVALAAACAVMLAINPLLLRYDIGFQLSVAATAGIMLLYPIAETRWRDRPLGWVWEALAVTISAQILVLPIIAYHFGTVSLIGVPANLVVLPLVPPAMGLAALAACAGMVPSIGIPVGIAAHAVLGIIVAIARWAAAVPMATVPVVVHAWHVWIFYGIVMVVYGIFRKRQHSCRCRL